MGRHYVYRGKEVAACQGDFRDSSAFCTFWKASDGSARRLRHPELPEQASRSAAQGDLDRFAELRKLKVLERSARLVE